MLRRCIGWSASKFRISCRCYVMGFGRLTQDDGVSRKHRELRMKFLSEGLLAIKLPGRTCRCIRRESEARRPYSQCYLQREEHLVSAMIPPPGDTHILLQHQTLQRQRRHRSFCQMLIETLAYVVVTKRRIWSVKSRGSNFDNLV
jgi:hypothetical protein